MPAGTLITLAADSTGGGLSIALLVVFGVIALALAILFVAAVVSILRSDRLSAAFQFGWIILCLILQFFGPLLWFWWGRRQDFGGRGGAVRPGGGR